MTLTQSDVFQLLDAIRAGGDIDVIRKGVELVLQALIDAEATEAIGAEPYERAESRSTWRNGGESDCWPRRPATSGSRSPSCARAVLPIDPGAPPAHRSGPVRCGHGGLRARGVDPQGR